MTPYLPTSSRRKRFVMVFLPLLALFSMILVACGGPSGPSGNTNQPAKTQQPLRVLASPGQPNADLISPFFDANHGGAWGGQGLLYEELYFTNLYTGETKPWLAESYSYNNDLSQLTFKLRQGVKWSDGQDFSSADVKFTFDLIKQHPALDQNGVMPIIKDVAAPDNSTVVFTLVHPLSTALYHIGAQVFIAPQHVWANVSGDPAKFANDKNPVGTGPYKLTSFSPDLITWDANPNYWGTKPQVQKIQAVSVKDNTTAITDMIQSKLDWAGIGWSPDNDKPYTDKDPEHHKSFFAASNTVMLYLNLTKAPYNNLLVRKAINAAINRDQLPQGVAQYAKVAHPTGVVIPTLKDWIGSQYQSATFQYSTSQAEQYLQQAGFKKGSDGFYHDASGKLFTMPIDVVNGWNDWDQDVQFMVNDLNKVGIKASLNSQSDFTPYFDRLSTGKYDAAISWTNAGPTPYYEYQALLSSSNSAPAGKAVSGTNFMRWDSKTSNGFSAQTDKLIAQYEATADPNAQKQAIAGIEDIMVKQLPSIPLTVNVNWAEYNTSHWTGFPSTDNPYDFAAPFQVSDFANVILQLKPAS